MNGVENLQAALLLASIVLLLIVVDILLGLSLLFSWWFPVGAYECNSAIANYFWGYFQLIFEEWHQASISFSGDSLPSGESAVVLCNHGSWSDFYLIQSLARRSGMLGRCRYFVKKSLAYVPFLGPAFLAVRMVMVSRNWTRDQTTLEQTFGGIKRYRYPIWLISFVEGTRMTPKKLVKSNEDARSRGGKPLAHVLQPRTKGFIATLRGLRDSHVKYVYDFSIAYASKDKFLQPPTVWETLGISRLDQHFRFHVHVRRWAIADLPSSETALAAWLEEQWVEKDHRLAEIKAKWALEV